jgi:hypothetical protein
LAQAYPELISYIDAEGNAIVDVTNASKILASAMDKAARASADYYEARKNEYKAKIAANEDYEFTDVDWYLDNDDKEYVNLGLRESNLALQGFINAEGIGFGVNYKPIEGVRETASSIPFIDEGENKVSVKAIMAATKAKGVDMNKLLMAAQGVDIELTEDEKRWLDFMTSASGLNGAVFARDSNGIITGWHATIDAVLKGQQGLAELEALAA